MRKSQKRKNCEDRVKRAGDILRMAVKSLETRPQQLSGYRNVFRHLSKAASDTVATITARSHNLGSIVHNKSLQVITKFFSHFHGQLALVAIRSYKGAEMYL